MGERLLCQGVAGDDLADAEVFRQFFHEKISLAGSVFFLFAGHFDALAGLDRSRVSEEVVGLPIAFIEEKE